MTLATAQHYFWDERHGDRVDIVRQIAPLPGGALLFGAIAVGMTVYGNAEEDLGVVGNVLLAGLFTFPLLVTVAWCLVGREYVSIDPVHLTITRRTGPLHGRSKRFEVAKIDNLRLDAELDWSDKVDWARYSKDGILEWASAYLGLSRGNILFDYDGETERFGARMGAGAARELRDIVAAELEAVRR